MRLTFDDLLDYLAGYLGKDVSTSGVAAIRSAAQAGIRELQGHHDWSYYRTLGRINTVASYSTGTITYDHTGSANELEVTLAGGTWPSWAASGILIIAGVPYVVATRVSNSIITLSSLSNPGADVAAGTGFIICQETYSLPEDYGKIGNTVVGMSGDSNPLAFVDPQEMVLARRNNPTVGRPECFSIVGSPSNNGTEVMRVWPFPDAIYNIDFDYRRRPSAIRVSGQKTGLVSITSASATVTGVNTNFTSRMEGAVFRVGEEGSKNVPTGLSGLYPALFEGVIDTVASATSLTLTSAADQTISRAPYCISDPVDVEPGTMETALYVMCTQALRRLSRMTPTPDEVRSEVTAIAAAKDNDARFYGERGVYRPSYGRSIFRGPMGTSSTTTI